MTPVNDTWHSGPTSYVRLLGALDFTTHDRVRDVIIEALHLVPPAAGLLVDVSGVTFCDCAGIAALVHGRVTAAAQGTPYRLTGVHGMVLGVAEQLELDPTLLIPLSRPRCRAWQCHGRPSSRLRRHAAHERGPGRESRSSS